MEGVSDATRSVNGLNQTDGVGIHIHPNALDDIRTVSISKAALNLDRPDGSTQGGFLDAVSLRLSCTRTETHHCLLSHGHHIKSKEVCARLWLEKSS